MRIYYIRDNAILQNMLAEVRAIQHAGGLPKVSVSDTKESRSEKQNRLLHKWFRDIANSAGNDLVSEAGRCKLGYFLPAMRASEREEARLAAEIIDTVWRERGYEYAAKALGTSSIVSTRTLPTKEFAQALTAMQASEAEHFLTDPETYGLDTELTFHNREA